MACFSSFAIVAWSWIDVSPAKFNTLGFATLETCDARPSKRCRLTHCALRVAVKDAATNRRMIEIIRQTLAGLAGMPVVDACRWSELSAIWSPPKQERISGPS